MIELIHWFLTSSIRSSYLVVRASLRLPLLLPIPPRVQKQVAGTLAIALWFTLLIVWSPYPTPRGGGVDDHRRGRTDHRRCRPNDGPRPGTQRAWQCTRDAVKDLESIPG